MTDSAKPTLLVVDGHSLAFRAFYALPLESFRTRDGQHTNAIHGFISMLLSLLKAENPSHLAVAFDISRYSFRTRQYPDYKATRGETPPEFIGQVPLLQEALAAMNIRTVVKEDFEADDILATLAARGEAAGYRVLVVSGDRDTIQLVNDNVTLLYPSSQGVSALTRYDRNKVKERYGIEPEQYPDVAALVGETSDNLVGISKVGEKTAVKWLTQYGSLQAILDNAEEISGVVGQNLREQKQNAIRNRALNALVRDVELNLELDDLQRGPIGRDAVREVFTRLQFRTLLDRVLGLDDGQAAHSGTAAGGTDVNHSAHLRPENAAGSAISARSASTVGSVRGVVPPPYAPPPAARELLDEELEGWISRASQAGPIGVQFELRDGGIGAVGLASADGSILLDYRPGAADYAPLEVFLASDREKVFFDLKPQLKAAARVGITVAGTVHDALLAAQLYRPHGPERSLAAVVSVFLGETFTEVDPQHLVPHPESATVAELAWFTRRVFPVIFEALTEAERAVYRDIEGPVISCLARLEERGVRVNHGQLVDLGGQLRIRASTIAAEAFREIGREVNLASPKQLQEVLFEQLGLPKTRATKTGYTTDAQALTELQDSHPHPFLGLVLAHRDVTKLGQIVETLEKSILSDGRVHTTYAQIGAATGRLSSNDPNLQNIPVRTEDGRRIRAAFEAGAEYDGLLTADYSQIEMRIMAHLSEDPGLIEAFNVGEDLHRFVGARIFGVPPEEVTAEQRSKVKAMSYGLAYGLSAFGLAKQLGISQADAKTLMSDYFSRFGAVRDYLRGVVELARQTGYTETIFGRRRPFPDLASPNRQLRENAERAALNAPIQGSAADIIKIAMARIESRIAQRKLHSRMLLQVHDELVFEYVDAEREELETVVRTEMAGAAELLVPLEVQVGSGANWDAAAH